MTARPAHDKRHRKNMKRKNKIAWWCRAGGQHGGQVARGGVAASSRYGSVVHGLPASHLRDLRRTQAATGKIKAGGASLTARLAVGGKNYTEADPAVYIGSASLHAVLCKIWDEPSARRSLVRGWSQARRELSVIHPTKAYRHARGPIGASWVYLTEWGAEWKAPFKIRLLDHEINILEVPPIQVKKILMEHVRIQLGLSKR